MLHSFIFIISAMAVGFIVYTIIYFKNNHAIVKFGYGIINDVQLMIILAIVGLFLSLL